MATRPEWRYDPLTGRRVLISPDRAERPRAVGPACPFCEGHESETPPEVLAYRDPGSQPNGPGWRVRVVPNRFAAVRLDAERGGSSPTLPKLGPGSSETYIQDSVPGIGVAEVFLECPHHESAFRKLTARQAADVFRAWRDRLRFWRKDGRLAFAQVFKNEGPAAGASVEHCHSQLIGIPYVPRTVDDENRRAGTERCAYCDWITAERRGPRWVTASTHFAVICPAAPRFPGESWVLPRKHTDTFELETDSNLVELASVVLDLVARVSRGFGEPDFNLIVRSAPFKPSGRWHWRMEFLPRTTTTAGWEWGTGLLINTMFPERAA